MWMSTVSIKPLLRLQRPPVFFESVESDNANHAERFWRGTGVAVLHKVYFAHNVCREYRLIETLKEEPSVITEYFRLEQEHV
jgi:hypothetical protein